VATTAPIGFNRLVTSSQYSMRWSVVHLERDQQADD